MTFGKRERGKGGSRVTVRCYRPPSISQTHGTVMEGALDGEERKQDILRAQSTVGKEGQTQRERAHRHTERARRDTLKRSRIPT